MAREVVLEVIPQNVVAVAREYNALRHAADHLEEHGYPERAAAARFQADMLALTHPAVTAYASGHTAQILHANQPVAGETARTTMAIATNAPIPPTSDIPIMIEAREAFVEYCPPLASRAINHMAEELARRDYPRPVTTEPAVSAGPFGLGNLVGAVLRLVGIHGRQTIEGPTGEQLDTLAAQKVLELRRQYLTSFEDLAASSAAPDPELVQAIAEAHIADEQAHHLALLNAVHDHPQDYIPDWVRESPFAYQDR